MNEERCVTISVAAAALDVSVSWMRLAERLGVVPHARRTQGGQRRYTLEDIEHLRNLGIGQRPRKLTRPNEVLEASR